ncbi:MAG: hypothetical protein IH616_01325 [Gemmatimonadales bacterium]|nr:hypothetical protein [Gemmatimonadales bacterium]
MLFSPFIVPVALFFTIGAVAILRGPIGKALADRLAGRVPHQLPSIDGEDVRTEVDELRYRVAELEERLDFAERVLAQQREPDRLTPGS